MSDIEQSFPGSATEDEKEEPSKREDNSSRTTSRSSAQSALSSVDVELDETEWGTDEETEKEEPVESSVCDTGTQTEWSWIADFLALTKLRGIDVDDEGVAAPSKPETASALTVTTSSQATAQSSAADESARPPSSIASTKASAAAAVAATSSIASRRQIADLPEILRYIRESELPPLASNDTLRRPSTVPPSVSLPACISVVCRLCDVNLADQSQSELNIYCPMCVNLLQDHARTLNDDDDEDEKISLIDISTTKSRKRSSKDKDGGDRASSEVSGRAASSIGFHRQLSPKEKRKAGRERAMAKLRERELEAKMREHEIARQRALGDPYSSMYDRNMKTITYALSSQRCLDKGWTIRPRKPRPKPRESDKPDVVEMKDHMRMAKDCVLERYYADDTPFLLFMPDGSGQCYYPSGNVAVSVASYESGFNYVIKADGPKPHNDDNDDNEKLCLSSDDFDEFMSANEDEKKTNDDSSRRKEGQILAYFSPSGHGCCYHENGVARLVLEPFGGAVYDSDGAQKKRWHWRDSPQRHQHVPPCQPIWFALNRNVSIRCSDQDNVTVTFSCRQRTVRFSVGWNLKWKAGARPSRTISGGELWRASLRATRRRLNGLLVGLNEALRYPKTCERRIVALRPTGESASKIRIA
ncbi:glutamate-rich protein 6-like [Oscarella lobularis]|uniref:glutamate-rich protein 6-like n=1 Tax=Oscarella lobularis TaxID=121494 RepID=UPI00331413D8